MLGVALSVSYFEMLLFFGMVTLSTYLLIGHWWQREEAASAAVRAFIISAIGDLALLAAVAYIYLRFNELNFQTLAGQYVSGRIIRELRTERLSEMGGLWQRMRFTGSVMLIAVAAASGIPPFSTFWSKDTIMSKALALKSPLTIAVIVAVTFLGAMALVRIFALAFTGETARRRRFEPDRIRDVGGR